MQEKTLLKIAVVCSLIGIFIVLLIVEKLDASESNIASITKDDLNEKVKVKGYINSIKETPGLLILNVKDDTGNITAILFKEDDINLKKGDLIEIDGVIKEYKGKLEIETDSIRLF